MERIAAAPVPIGRVGRPVGRPPVRHAGPAARRGRRHRHGPGRAGRPHRGPARSRAGRHGRLRRRRRRAAQRVGRARPRPARSTCSTSESPTRASRRSPTWSTRSTATRRTASCCARPRSACSTTATARRHRSVTVRFSKLGLVDQLFHTVASPAVTYLLLLIGAGAADLRVLHGRRRHRRRGRRDVPVLACTGLADAAGPGVGGRR